MSLWNVTGRSWGLACVLILAVTGSASAQDGVRHVDAWDRPWYLKLGDIKGEAHPNGLEILSFSWGSPMKPGEVTPPPGVRSLTITKRVDKATPKLQEALAKGTRFPEATLLGGGSQEYLAITMRNVYISSYQMGGSQERPTESLSLNFEKVKYEYATKKDGKEAAPGPVRAGYDLKKAEKAGPAQPGLVAAVADLLPLNGLTVATSFIPWGQTATISTDAASSKQGGRCFFRYLYRTGNQGQAGAGATTNRIHLDAANGPSLADDALPALAAGDEHTSSGLLPLVPGTWTLYVHVDDDLVVAEGDEQNNLRRVRVRVDGSCR